MAARLALLPPSPPIHRERRRLRKKSRPPPNFEEGIFELDDRVELAEQARPVTPEDPKKTREVPTTSLDRLRKLEHLDDEDPAPLTHRLRWEEVERRAEETCEHGSFRARPPGARRALARTRAAPRERPVTAHELRRVLLARARRREVVVFSRWWQRSGPRLAAE